MQCTLQDWTLHIDTFCVWSRTSMIFSANCTDKKQRNWEPEAENYSPEKKSRSEREIFLRTRKRKLHTKIETLHLKLKTIHPAEAKYIGEHTSEQENHTRKENCTPETEKWTPEAGNSHQKQKSAHLRCPDKIVFVLRKIMMFARITCMQNKFSFCAWLGSEDLQEAPWSGWTCMGWSNANWVEVDLLCDHLNNGHLHKNFDLIVQREDFLYLLCVCLCFCLCFFFEISWCDSWEENFWEGGLKLDVVRPPAQAWGAIQLEHRQSSISIVRLFLQRASVEAWCCVPRRCTTEASRASERRCCVMEHQIVRGERTRMQNCATFSNW